jgi:Tol biopolymer transport system component
MSNERPPDKLNTLLARIVVALGACVLLSAAAVAYLWLRPASEAQGVRQIAYAAIGTEGNLDLFLADAAGQNIRPLTQTPEHEAWPVWSPDGKQLAFVRISAQSATGGGRSPDSGVYLLTLEGDKPVERRIGDMSALGWAEPAWSPDGRRVAWLRTVLPGREGGPITSELVIVNVATLATETHPLTPTVSATSVSWAPDGQSLALSAYMGVVSVPPGRAPTLPESAPIPIAAWVYNVANRTLSPVASDATRVRWSPTGEWLAYTDTEKGNGVRLVRPDGTGAYALLDRGYVMDFAWSPDGARLAAAVWDDSQAAYVLYIYKVEDGTATVFPIMGDRQSSPQDIAWSPDGVYLSYSLFWLGTGSLPHGNLWILDTRTGAVFAFPDSPGLEGLAVWRPGSH